MVEDNTIENRIAEIDKQINKLMDLYQLDTIPIDQISERIEKLYKEKKALSSEVKETKVEDAINIEDVLVLLEDFDEVWDELEIEQKKEIATLLLGEKIYI